MVSNTHSKEQYKVVGMTCASCASSIESYLKSQVGVFEVVANYPNNSVFIEYNPSEIGISTIQEKAKEIGYTLIAEQNDNTTSSSFEIIEAERLRLLKIKLIASLVFSIPVFIMSMFFMGKIPYENWIMMILSIPALFWCGSEFYIIAWNKIKHLSTNMDTLVALSTGVAFSFSVFNTLAPSYLQNQGITPHVYYESAVVIISLILLGRFLEERAKGKTSSAIKKLIGLQSKEVVAIRNGEETVLRIEDIIKGDLIVIKPGDKIPVDGKVKRGESYIDESMITGEPMPINKSKGDMVIAGTINQKGTLKILAEKIGNETLLSQIIKMVERAQSTKPNIQRLADKIAGIFVPIVLVLSVISFALWYFIGPEPRISHAMLALITVLIIACPCALGLATPTALMVGIGKGAQHGILIKDALALELAYKTDVVILDKTGTITQGRPQVTDFIWVEKSDDQKYQEILLSIEKSSEHPIAEAICKDLIDKDVNKIELDFFNSVSGKGVIAEQNERYYRVGKPNFILESIELSPDNSNQIASLESEGKTVVLFSEDERIICIIAVADKLKEASVDAISSLKGMGIEVHMLTGDNEKTASLIASQAGIDKFESNAMPVDKSDYVQKLQSQGRIVTMVGDGINDSGALAQADIGVAMGSGTDIAMESAGITILNSNLNQLSTAILLSKLTMKTIRQNLFWAFIYNIVAIPIAAGALFPIFNFTLNPMIAGAAMSLSSISVLTNSLRLKTRKI